VITMKSNKLEFAFPEVHEDAKLYVTFKRTLRIPDNESAYSLPPGLGDFPLRLVDDFGEKVPDKWLERGGVMLPMYQSEAMWIQFTSDYPFAVKVAAGKVNAVTGEDWTNEFQRSPQDYVVPPKQPWIDGFCVGKGVIRQFVAMPLGSGYSAEEQISGEAEYGGVQLIVSPMKPEAYRLVSAPRPFERVSSDRLVSYDETGKTGLASALARAVQKFGKQEPEGDRAAALDEAVSASLDEAASAAMEGGMLSGPEEESNAFYGVSDQIQELKPMSLAPGGRMKQKIYDDPYLFSHWDFSTKSRCFVHLSNSLTWRAITGERPPTTPFTAAEYTQHGLPWFEIYDDSLQEVPGSETLAALDSVAALGMKKGDVPLPENRSVTPQKVLVLRRGLEKDQVREGQF